MSMNRAIILLFVSIVSFPRFVNCETRGILKVDDTTYSFGTVHQGEKIVRDFDLKNTGNADLQIQRVAPSCGCTAAAVTNPVIKPGETAKVHVEFDTTGFEGDKVKTVQVFTSDLDNPELTLTLKGSILPSATIDPVRLEFGEIAPGAGDQNWRKNFSVALAEGSNLSIQKVRSFSKYLSVTEVPGTAPSQKTYEVILDKSVPRGPYRERVLVELSGAKPVVLNIPVTAFVRGDLRVEPSTISFGVIEGKIALERSVKFENAGTHPVVIKGISSSSAAISTEIKELKPGQLYVVRLRLDPAKVTTDLRASVDIATDRTDEELVSLNVVGVLPPR